MWSDVLNQTLVDSHLVAVPGLGSLTTGGLAGGDLEDLGRETDGSLDAKALALGALDELRGDYMRPESLASFPFLFPLSSLSVTTQYDGAYPSREPGPCKKSR